MDKLPFAPYDFFGYLASGLALLAGVQMAFGFPQVLGRQLTLVDTAFLILAVYILGQILATPSKALLEDVVVQYLLRRPSTNLFRSRKPRVRGLIFPAYYKPLAESARDALFERVRAEGGCTEGEDLFSHVRFSDEVRRDDKLMARIDGFRNQYGFNRNLSFTGLLIAAILLVRGRDLGSAEMKAYGLAAACGGVLLFYRYLKFYRQYSYELFNSYRAKRQGRLV